MNDEEVKKEKIELEKTVDEYTGDFIDEYKNTIAVISFLITSDKTLRQKVGLINEFTERLKEKQAKFVEKSTRNTFLFNVRKTEGFLGIKKSKLSPKQERELSFLILDMKLEMNTIADVLRMKSINAARRIEQRKTLFALSPEKEIREKKINESPKIVFNDSLGRKINPINQVRLTASDSLWNTAMTGLKTVMIANALTTVIHKSILDDRTTPLCRSLNGKKRNILVDQLPPMHAYCRSYLIPYKPKNESTNN